MRASRLSTEQDIAKTVLSPVTVEARGSAALGGGDTGRVDLVRLDDGGTPVRLWWGAFSWHVCSLASYTLPARYCLRVGVRVPYAHERQCWHVELSMHPARRVRATLVYERATARWMLTRSVEL